MLEIPNSSRSTSERRSVAVPVSRQHILDAYLAERAKFVAHIKKRAIKFERKSREDYNRAKWGKEKATMNRLAVSRVAEASRSFATSSTALVAKNRIVMKTETLAEVKKREKLQGKKTQAQKDAELRRRSARKAEKDALAASMLSTEEAIAVLQAVEAGQPNTLFDLSLTIGSKGSIPNLRGRANLPYDIKKTADVILVFAEDDTESARLAKEAGVQYVGGADLFEEVEEGKIRPTKVLSTPSMLPAVTSRLGRFLGQRGLMPTARRGGVGEGLELVKRIQEARGATDWFTNEKGRLRINFGRNTLPREHILANFRSLISSVRDTFPVAGAGDNDDALVSRIKRKKPKKTTWFEEVHMTSSNGPRIRVSDADSA
ncbi:ribosomal protein L1-like protein [Kockovaella imperatae]|uniref:Ribosomal protein L1-like protein n=1 Tax=Kockovaella imperatae TaxID=4999 RepID=A0A1Y1UTH5_9TREE|nr:ribosomal protein L1-like protein [Kockovaella imperatae]ORX40917.1 ribosomal protein L1-like protein [Kockovaella imperatae]